MAASVRLRRGRRFELIVDTHKGNRPSFTDAPPELAEPLYKAFCDELTALGVQVERGVFGARMAVELVWAEMIKLAIEPPAFYSEGRLILATWRW